MEYGFGLNGDNGSYVSKWVSIQKSNGMVESSYLGGWNS